MHLSSLSIRGFKSFPQRTRLEFSPGVGVIVGPNGSGKSNVTDAVLWALGEQSPLAIRGQTMQDVIFAGGHGVKGSSSAEVEVVIDNSDGQADTEFAEISIMRRLDRSGDGEYRLNGARCRLADIVEVLSDTGLGKEMHSVVSQGRVESIVLSRPRERRLLIEEAAGLGKHRKRRRKAQLKLERTEDNLARALDVEREARSRLRPLKRQSEAAQLHERIERQSDEARHELLSDDLREADTRLASAQGQATAARAERDKAELALKEVAAKREQAEAAFAQLSGEREALQASLYKARSAAERIGLRLERARDQAGSAVDGGERRAAQLALLEAGLAEGGDPTAGVDERIAELQGELDVLEGDRERRLEQALAELDGERASAVEAAQTAEGVLTQRRGELEQAEAAAERARTARREVEREVEQARRAAAETGGELAALNQLLRSATADTQGTRALSEGLDVAAGYELAVAAVLGPRMGAGVVESVGDGERVLDGAGQDGGMVIVSGTAVAAAAGGSPCAEAQRLLDHVDCDGSSAPVVTRLLARAWVVADLDTVSADFEGIAVTRAGRVWAPGAGELRQAPSGGAEQALERRNRRTELVAQSERAVRAEAETRKAADASAVGVLEADSARETAEAAVRAAQRTLDEAREAVRSAEWLIQRRREAPEEGPDAVRRAELSAEIRAERRVADGARREREEAKQRAVSLRGRIERDGQLAKVAARAADALELAQDAVAARVWALEHEREVGAQAGEQTAAALRACAHEEAEVQGALRANSETVTATEVAAAQARDGAREATRQLAEVAERLGGIVAGAPAQAEAEDAPAQVPAQPLSEERREELAVRIDRLARRREQLGPVNPLAAKEYEEAVAHVDELETQRGDLESALSELRTLIRDTDRRIRESFEQTFEAAAKNFEDVVAHLFPGGRGRLRLVSADQTPRPVLGGAEPEQEGDSSEPDEDEDEVEVEETSPGPEELGVEIEVTPAGKSTKRLSLMSGGEKSLVALAFMFSVFLAKPCPFYILDEVEAALDDLNIDRFLQLVRRYSDRAQFIVVTHQKRTMDAADCLYGVSMGGDGISRVVSRKLGGQLPFAEDAAEADSAAGAA